MTAGFTRRGAIALGAAGMSGLGTARAAKSGQAFWSDRAPLPLRTQEIYAAAFGGEIWVAGGLSPDARGPKRFGDLGITGRVVAYDPGSDRWREAPPLPAPRHHAHLAAHDGRLWVVGGFVGTPDGAWHMTDSVLILDGDAWREVAPLPVPQAETVCASLGDRLHCVTGRRPAGSANAAWSDHADTNAHLAYDAAADRWSVRAPAPTARNSASGTVGGRRLFVVGGRTVTGGNARAFEAYDAETDSWRVLPDMPEGRGGLAACMLDARLIAIGGEWFGESGGGVYADVLAYDAGGGWSVIGAMPVPRHGLGLAAIGDTAYAVGGAAAPSGNGTSASNTALRLRRA